MEWVLGVNVPGHGGSVCLLHYGEVVFYLKEERVSRLKLDSSLPLLSLNHIPNYTKKIDCVIAPNCTGDQIEIIKNQLFKLGITASNSLEKVNIPTDGRRQLHEYHHLAHASSGYYASGFDEAICIVMDGWGHVGEFVNHMKDGDRFAELDPYYLPLNMYETFSVYHTTRPNNFYLIQKDVNYDGYRFDELEFKYSKVSQIDDDTLDDRYSLNTNIDIGVVYEIITRFLGFKQDDCGKTMGMSAYGEEDDEVPPFFINDSLTTNANLFTNSSLINDINYPILKKFNTFQKQCNLAYAVQKALEKKVLYRFENAMSNVLKKGIRCKNIVLSGGIFHNIVVNSLLVEKYPEYNFYVDALCDDCGHSFGMSKLICSKSKSKLESLYLGPEYNSSELKYRIFKEILKNQNK